MLDQPNAIWGTILKHKYLEDMEYLTYILPKQGSWIWKGIKKGIQKSNNIIHGKLVMVFGYQFVNIIGSLF